MANEVFPDGKLEHRPSQDCRFFAGGIIDFKAASSIPVDKDIFWNEFDDVHLHDSIAPDPTRRISLLVSSMLTRATFGRTSGLTRRSFARSFSHRFPVMAAPDENTSGITVDSLQASLTTRLDATHVEVEDMSGKPLPSLSAICMR